MCSSLVYRFQDRSRLNDRSVKKKVSQVFLSNSQKPFSRAKEKKKSFDSLRFFYGS